jgi:uncharacterized protein YfaS (alpha-2-macroglobulin family)
LKKFDIPAEKFDASFREKMRAGMKRILMFQHASGGWGWFKNDKGDPFMTAKAVHGLGECQRLGYEVDAEALRRGRERLLAMAKEEKDLNRLAYAVYVLGEGFERLLEAPDDLSPYAQALLVLTLHTLERPEAAGIARKLAARVQEDHWETKDWYYKWDNVSIETTAYAIRALAAVDPKHALLPKATEWLLRQRKGNRWRSTKDTAEAITSLLEVASLGNVANAVERGGKGEKYPVLARKIGVTLDGKTRREILVNLNNPLESVFEAHFDAAGPGGHDLAFTGVDDSSGFEFDVEVSMRVFESAAKPVSQQVAVKVEYDRPLEELRVGDEVNVTATVSAQIPSDYVMVLSPIPAGCEVVRGSGEGTFSEFEARYEKAIFFLRSLDDKPQKLRYKMRCGFAGKFTVQPPWAGLMYNEDLFGAGRMMAASVAP